MFKFVRRKQDNPDQISRIIENLEVKYNITFPEVLKELYRESASGNIETCYFEVDGYEIGVHSLIPVESNDYCFEKIVDTDREDGFVPDTYYPFMDDEGGDIYYWDDETEKVYLVRCDDIENPYFISDTVKGFFDLINSSIG